MKFKSTSKRVLAVFHISLLFISCTRSQEVNAISTNIERNITLMTGTVGSGALRRFNRIFDYANKKLYIKPNSHFNKKSG